LQQRVIQNNDNVRRFHVAAPVYGLLAQTRASDHRRAAPFGAEERKILRMKTGEKTRPPQDAARNLSPLPAPAMETYFNHPDLAPC
jgi:hypothetical protein